MEFSLEKSIEVLERTPGVLMQLVQNISPEWTSENEGGESWSVYDIIGHLIHGEQTDWMVRLNIILFKEDKRFEVFDRNAQFANSKGKSLGKLLEEFCLLRKENLQKIISLHITETDLDKKGIHPEFGEVNAAQLISTWVVHDLNHIAQISRVMAKQYKKQVGPWIQYLSILNK